MIWQYLIPILVFAQTATPSASLSPIPSFTPTPTPLPLMITGLPDQITSGQQFCLTLNLHAKTNLSYQFKVYGGVNGDNYSYEVQNNGSWTNGYNGAWDSLPQSTTDSGGNSTLEITVRFRPDKSSGTSSLIAKVKEIAANTYTTSSAYSLDVIDPSPTPLPSTTATPTPTNTPLPTSTPTVTPTPTTTPFPSITSIPSDTPFPVLTPIPENTSADDFFDKPSSSFTAAILGASTSASISTNSSSLSNLIPLFFIIGGGILLTTPLMISQINKTWPRKS